MASIDDITQMLRDTDIPRDMRQRVQTPTTLHKRGMVLGLVVDYATLYLKPSHNTGRHKMLARALCRLARDLFPEFVFTSIMVNEGGSSLHVDKNNCGPSIILSLGDHTGGELWQWSDDGQGEVLSIKDKPTECNGLVPHVTLPFQGERFSLVYYCVRTSRKPPNPADAEFLRGLGFKSVEQIPKCKSSPPRHDLLPFAALKVRALLSDTTIPQHQPIQEPEPEAVTTPKVLLELFAGTGSVGKAFLQYGWEVVSLDTVRGKQYPITIRSDILTWDYKDAYPPNYFDAIHASPPCTHYSIARTSGKTPRDLVGADRLVDRTLDIIEYFKPKVWLIENPYTGLMKSRPCMAGMDRYLRTVCYCRYGMQYRKSTAVWTNLGDYWTERPMCTYHNPCEKVVDGRHPTTAQQRDGFSVKQLYSIPKELCDELAIAVIDACDE